MMFEMMIKLYEQMMHLYIQVLGCKYDFKYPIGRNIT